MRHPAGAERVHQAATHHFVHQRLLAEADLGFRRMHVHVERVGRHLEEQMHLGAALLDRRHAVGVDDGVRDGLVLDDAPIDEDVLRPASGPLLGQRRDEAEHQDAASLLAHLEQVGAVAVELIEPILQRARGRALQHGARSAGQGEPDLGIGERQLRGDARDLPRLGPVRLQELPSRRQIVEEVVDLDDRAWRGRHFLLGRNEAAVHTHFGAAVAVARARPQREVRNGGDRRQRLAAEPVRQDGGEVVGPADLARGMTLERQPRIIRVHPLAVILDPNLLLAAELDVDDDAAGAGINGVLDEFLDDRGRSLDDLTRRDLVGEVIGKPGDPSHVRPSAVCGKTTASRR